MKKELVCSWLGLAKADWPPDPRTLLGVGPDEHNLSVIEKRVQDCMGKLRLYQLSYPEEATEGMNRLAEAFIALTETCSRKKMLVEAAPDEPASVPYHAEAEGVDLPPVRAGHAEAPEAIPGSGADAEKILIAKPFVPPTRALRKTIDPALVRELAEESEEATSNLATLDAVIERVDRTRALLHAWDRLGRLLKGASKKPTPKETDAFAARLEKVASALEKYPGFLGHPGKPGYRVFVQARLGVPLAMVRGMTPEQRDELLYDWSAGRQILLAHRKYLRRVFKSLRHRSALGLFWHAVRALVNDYPGWALLAAALLVATIAAIVYMRS